MAVHQMNNSKPGDMNSAQGSAKQFLSSSSPEAQECSGWRLGLQHAVLTQFAPGRERESPKWHLSIMSGGKMETVRRG